MPTQPNHPTAYRQVRPAAEDRLVTLGIEQSLDGQVEVPRQRERDREARVIFAGLDGVDRLPGQPDRIGEGSLTDTSFGPELAQPVLHQRPANPEVSPHTVIPAPKTIQCPIGTTSPATASHPRVIEASIAVANPADRPSNCRWR